MFLIPYFLLRAHLEDKFAAPEDVCILDVRKLVVLPVESDALDISVGFAESLCNDIELTSRYFHDSIPEGRLAEPETRVGKFSLIEAET